MGSNDDYLNVVDFHNMNESGSRDLRLANVDGTDEWYVYTFSLATAQITHGNGFARHSASGLRYLFSPMTEVEARREFARRKKMAN